MIHFYFFHTIAITTWQVELRYLLLKLNIERKVRIGQVDVARGRDTMHKYYPGVIRINFKLFFFCHCCGMTRRENRQIWRMKRKRRRIKKSAFCLDSTCDGFYFLRSWPSRGFVLNTFEWFRIFRWKQNKEEVFNVSKAECDALFISFLFYFKQRRAL